MTAWIQRHDYSSEETDLASAAEAEGLFRAFDWKSEIQLEDEARAGDIDCCPPGMGLVSNDKRNILHIVPTGGSVLMVHFMYSGAKKWSNWTGEYFLSVSDFPGSLLRPLIEHHFADDTEAIASMLTANGTPMN
jgi:hypothetical protein